MNAHRFTLADDDPDALFLLEHMLQRLYPGSSFCTFSNAEDALAHILVTGTDILITDHGMGKMSGTELISQLRRRKWAIPIIMLSGSPSAEAEAMAAGATVFVDKNSPPRFLEAHLRALIEVLDFTAPRAQTRQQPLKRHGHRPHPVRKAEQ